MKIKLIVIFILLTSLRVFAQPNWERKYAPLQTKFNYINKIGGRVFICAGLLMGNNDYGYYSDDNGDTWTRIPELLSTYQMANVSGVLYATSNSSLYRSFDNGTSWSLHGSSIPVNVISFKENNGFLYAAGSYNFYMSADTGSTWQEIDSVGWNSIAGFAVENGNIFIYRSTTKDFMYSPNNGLTFSIIPLPFDPFTFDFLTFKNSVLYAGSDKGFYISNDFGSTWTKEESGLTGLDTLIAYTTIEDSAIYITSRFGKIFKSPINSINWTQIGTSTFYNDPLFFDTGSEFFIGTERGFFKSIDNASSWTLHNQGIEPNTTPSSLTEKDGELWVGSDRGISRSNDSGNTWSAVLTEGELMFKTNDTIMTGDHWGNLEFSSDNGLSWQYSNPPEFNFVQAVCKLNSKWFIGTDHGLYTSTNDCSTLSLLDVDPANSNEWTFSIFKDNDGTIFVSMFNSAYKSEDNGLSWQIIPTLTGLMMEGGFSRVGADFYFWSRYGGVLKSIDNGTTWSTISSGLPGNNTWQLVNYNSELYVLAGIDYYGGFVSYGIYKLSGSVWVPFDTTMQHILMLGSGDNGLYIGLYEKGLFKLNQSVTSTPETTSAKSNINIYPNPTQNKFTVSFKNDCDATVNIHNIIGEIVFAQHYPAQKEFKETFDLSSQSKGVYIVEIISDKLREVRKIIVE